MTLIKNKAFVAIFHLGLRRLQELDKKEFFEWLVQNEDYLDIDPNDAEEYFEFFQETLELCESNLQRMLYVDGNAKNLTEEEFVARFAQTFYREKNGVL